MPPRRPQAPYLAASREHLQELAPFSLMVLLRSQSIYKYGRTMAEAWGSADFVDRTQGPVRLMGYGNEVMCMNDNYLQYIIFMHAAQLIHGSFSK